MRKRKLKNINEFKKEEEVDNFEKENTEYNYIGEENKESNVEPTVKEIFSSYFNVEINTTNADRTIVYSTTRKLNLNYSKNPVILDSLSKEKKNSIKDVYQNINYSFRER